MTNDLYPSGPQAVPAELTRPTLTYKQRAWLALASLALFVALYVALAGWFVWTAWRMIGEAVAGSPDALMHYLVGGSAAFLAVFMLKALVFIQRGGAPDAVEVTPAEQPRLFEFLHRLADEAGAPRPKRVYLSARVNAAVFYDLSVLNLLFPSRKNLEIGLALVNVLTLSEIKAVLAHEFGHFAQRSMAIGSWVYIAQQIAGHLVARRDALDKFLKFLSGIDLRIAWIGWLLSLIVWSIRSLMDTLLSVVVLAQRALSRQMEFQADLVAVSLTGSDELIHALHKLHAADDAWSQTLGFVGAELREGRAPHDLFAVHTLIIEKIARILDDETYGRVPRAASDNPQAHRVFKSSFAQPPQMWSTHPANADREANAKRQYLPAPHDGRSAWLLFDNPAAVKAKVAAQLLGKHEAKPASAEETIRAVEERYARKQYEPRYRGAYLGRPLTRHVARSDELYEKALQRADVRKALDMLYPAQLASDLAKLRELSEERGTLEALRDRVYQAVGGKIVHRGREISRRELPAAIRQVAQEEERVRERILTHDRHCRSAHLAAAGELGAGWKEYLLGLIGILHYAEHALADLRDAHGLLGNVLAVVTADGKVSGGELKRVIAVANVLQEVLADIHAQKPHVHLDASLCARLGVSGWPAMLEELKLPPASKENINDWLRVIDGWVDSTGGALGALNTAALEQLLLAEDEVARHLREGSTPEAAAAPSRVPREYRTLVAGQERKRQKRLGWWDRFQIADGVVPTLARLVVAGAIVGTVLGLGSLAGTTAILSVYNGLGAPVKVSVAGQQVTVAPFAARQIDVRLDEATTVAARSLDGRLIEQFRPELIGRSQHYVYNVAGAAPLVEWTAVYGSATERPPRFLGAPRWITSSADVFFKEPPKSVKTKSGGATRRVLSGAGDRAPSEVLELIKNEAERNQVIVAHAKWDRQNAPHAAEWQAIAQSRQ
ncbi:peptidase M48 family protein [Sulfurifustis variabilis]|uniref:Peptidase M48 family protein n=1 Tax=Sulfurifustis variabilis TaxID=1675686 RepID=A0A1B4V738_9GAMM|nr:M48 family metallopeptidase [Sulfurifustis variabilis]BAU49360.1 peptidase M48 family protein [Sulfurifustis variabilis]